MRAFLATLLALGLTACAAQEPALTDYQRSITFQVWVLETYGIPYQVDCYNRLIAEFDPAYDDPYDAAAQALHECDAGGTASGEFGPVIEGVAAGNPVIEVRHE
jgi:hypothetical protein